jgi:glycosyltransferase involved in cell wall biosynthesis
MNQSEQPKIAWLLPAMGNGGISFQHLLCEFTKVFTNTITFTGQWPGFARGFENTFVVQEVGSTHYVEFGKAANGYTIGFSFASPKIIQSLWKFKPQIVFANAFSAWTAIALLLKPIGGWKVIITYEGGSAVYEDPKSTVRHQSRRVMARFADAFVVNSQSGKFYLLNTLQINSEKIFAKPFLVPSLKALQQYTQAEEVKLLQSNRCQQRPILLFVGQIVPRKGLKTLLEACHLLRQRGYTSYTLMIVGDGEQRTELESLAQEADLEQQVVWTGKIPYHCLGAYFQLADLFIFPTYDDIWGMVLTEAMAFGKPVICSSAAGASEMIMEGSNGYTYPPEQVDRLTEVITKFLDNPALIKQFGDSSLHIMAKNTPKDAITSFIQATNYVLKDGEKQLVVVSE